MSKQFEQVLSLPVIATTEHLPADLPAYEKAAKGCASIWIDEICPLMIKSNSDIIDFEETFQMTSKKIQVYIPQLDDPSPEKVRKAKDKIVQCLRRVLIRESKEKRKAAVDIASRMKKFREAEFQPIYDRFQKALEKAKDDFAKDKEKLDGMQEELSEAEEEANQCKWDVATDVAVAAGGTAAVTAVCYAAVAGSAAPITSGIVAVAASFATGGGVGVSLSTGAVAVTGPIATVSAGGTAATVASVAVASPAFPVIAIGVAILGGIFVVGRIVRGVSNYKRYKTITNSEIFKLKEKVGLLENILDQYANLAACTQNAIECYDEVSLTWSKWVDELKTLVAHLEKSEDDALAEFSDGVKMYLEKAQKTLKKMKGPCLIWRQLSTVSDIEEKFEEYTKGLDLSEENKKTCKRVVSNFCSNMQYSL